AANGIPQPTYSLGGAPVWLTIDPTSGSVSGTPPAGTKSFGYSVLATNALGPATAGPFVVTVTAPSAPKADLAPGPSCPAAARVGTTVRCTLTVRNGGPAKATAVTGDVVLPPSMAAAGIDNGGRTFRRVDVWSFGDLAPNSSTTLSFRATMRRVGPSVLIGYVHAGVPGPRVGNNPAVAVVRGGP